MRSPYDLKGLKNYDESNKLICDLILKREEEYRTSKYDFINEQLLQEMIRNKIIEIFQNGTHSEIIEYICEKNIKEQQEIGLSRYSTYEYSLCKKDNKFYSEEIFDLIKNDICRMHNSSYILSNISNNNAYYIKIIEKMLNMFENAYL